jgi:hypothetical protein
MGQNVNYLLGGQNQLLGADPELYRQQLIQQEQQRIGAMPQMNQLGATVGGLLGRGIGNLAQDRNFFEVTNPVLQKLTKIQDIYDTSIKQSDPNDPLSFYTNLQKNFAGAGLGQQAMMAQVEGKKFEETNLKGEKLKTEVYTQNPQLLDAQIAKARDAGDNELADRLAQQRGQIQVKIDLDRSKEAADILLRQAQTEAQRAQAENLRTQAREGKVQIVQTPGGVGPNGVTPPTISVFRDGKLESQTPVVGAAPAAPTEAPKKGERPPLSSFTPQATPAAASTPAATPTAPSAPLAATNTTVSLYDQGTQTYKLSQDPEYLQIVQLARSNQQRLETDPAFQAQIQQAMTQLQTKRKSELGSFVKFQ